MIPLLAWWSIKTNNIADDPVFIVTAVLVISSAPAITLAQMCVTHCFLSSSSPLPSNADLLCLFFVLQDPGIWSQFRKTHQQDVVLELRGRHLPDGHPCRAGKQTYLVPHCGAWLIVATAHRSVWRLQSVSNWPSKGG